MMYAIKQISTGFYLPQIKSKKGYTWSEPVERCIPRLFKRKSDAGNALNYWLNGKLGWTRIEGNWIQSGDDELATTYVHGRARDDMAVVKVAITEVNDENTSTASI